jgi:hypothetical protein
MMAGCTRPRLFFMQYDKLYGKFDSKWQSIEDVIKFVKRNYDRSDLSDVKIMEVVILKEVTDVFSCTEDGESNVTDDDPDDVAVTSDDDDDPILDDPDDDN